VDEADETVFSLAEHTGRYSAAFKNTCDWVLRKEQKVCGRGSRYS
jgi:NAD(P)H-dependent FMN reductase